MTVTRDEDIERTTMELGLFVEPQCGGTYARLAELARWAEATGLDAFARSDHYLNMDASEHATDALVSFGGLARETESIELVSLVSPITFRHPAVMAKSATTIDEMSGGRFSLGVGSGWMQSEHDAFDIDLPELRERFERLEEALAVITTVFTGGGKTDGAYYALDAETVAPRASEGMGLVVGGSGMRKTPRLAGTYATEYNMFLTDRHNFEQRVTVMRSAAERAGRNPDDILVSFAGPGLVYRTSAEHEAALEEKAQARGTSVDEYVAILEARAVPHGTADEVRAAMASYASWGIGRYYVQEYCNLDDVDLDRLSFVFAALR
ncbi:MAG: LLM class flavin-dependent oxidoreductase [Acidimicrobiia bacterium]|nr:LLM class flavin-dependent oxidoreductase [Acidimicrobiia bacterium]